MHPPPPSPTPPTPAHTHTPPHLIFSAECFFGDYNFYMLYIFQMVLPFACVGLCVAAYHAAELVLTWKDPGGTRRVAGTASDGVIGWLEGLKIRWASFGCMQRGSDGCAGKLGRRTHGSRSSREGPGLRR